MKLQVTRENLNRALNSVARVANSRGTLPVLANVLIKTTNNRLSLSATNLDIAITHFIGAKVTNEGSITVPARLMQDFVSNLPDGVINLDLKETKLHINTNQYQSTINGIAADDFPVMPAISTGSSWKITAPTLKSALQQVVFAAASDETRPILTGALLQTSAGKLYLAATDSYRLAEKDLGSNKQAVKLLVPANALQDLLRIIADEDGEVQVTHDEQQVLFQVGDTELVTRLIEGNYPDYRKLIPASFATTAVLQRADFLNVTKVSSLFARESAGSVTIEVDEVKQQLSIRSVASQLGENTATAAAKVTGDGSITLNSRYLLDALNALTGDQVSFGFNGKLEASLLRDPANDDYLHLIMPLKS
ncbi:MAG TPA: DNA polymerase III subunit beta [Candidatus Saccharimonadales bacterium]|nr:DNA polymerase III subunit beta [Candidatus Saccharimonadales bacterium]HWB63044.1 DNA polymerase III subunit beta [Chitinophagales bacterium]